MNQSSCKRNFSKFYLIQGSQALNPRLNFLSTLRKYPKKDNFLPIVSFWITGGTVFRKLRRGLRAWEPCNMFSKKAKVSKNKRR